MDVLLDRWGKCFFAASSRASKIVRRIGERGLAKLRWTSQEFEEARQEYRTPADRREEKNAGESCLRQGDADATDLRGFDLGHLIYGTGAFY